MKLLWLSLALTCAAADQPPAVTAKVGELRHGKGRYAPHEGHEVVDQLASLATGALTYTLSYKACWDPAHGGGAQPMEGCLGMPGPSSTNWYHSNFLMVRVNGAALSETRLARMWLAETGARGNVKLAFDLKPAHVSLSFVALPGDDKLYCAITLQPREPITSLEVELMCYPSYFTYWNKRDGNRQLLTPRKLYPQGAKAALDPAAEWWLAFYDTIFDPARGEGDGGCAVAFDPAPVQSAGTDVGSYACPTRLVLKPDARQLRLVFWDFHQRGNEAALAGLKAALPETLASLKAMDFSPLALTGYPLADRRAEALRVLRDVPGSAPLAAEVERSSAELAALVAALRGERAGTPAMEAEEKLAAGVKAFDDLVWKCRFHALLFGP